jgi:hypothetical protein
MCLSITHHVGNMLDQLLLPMATQIKSLMWMFCYGLQGVGQQQVLWKDPG